MIEIKITNARKDAIAVSLFGGIKISHRRREQKIHMKTNKLTVMVAIFIFFATVAVASTCYAQVGTQQSGTVLNAPLNGTLQQSAGQCIAAIQSQQGPQGRPGRPGRNGRTIIRRYVYYVDKTGSLRKELRDMKANFNSQPFGGYGNQKKAYTNLQSVGFITRGQADDRYAPKGATTMPATPAGGYTTVNTTYVPAPAGSDPIWILVALIVGIIAISLVVWLVVNTVINGGNDRAVRVEQTRQHELQNLANQLAAGANRVPGSERLTISGTTSAFNMRVEPANPTPVLPAAPAAAPVPPQVVVVQQPAPPAQPQLPAGMMPAPQFSVAPIVLVPQGTGYQPAAPAVAPAQAPQPPAAQPQQARGGGGNRQQNNPPAAGGGQGGNP